MNTKHTRDHSMSVIYRGLLFSTIVFIAIASLLSSSSQSSASSNSAVSAVAPANSLASKPRRTSAAQNYALVDVIDHAVLSEPWSPLFDGPLETFASDCTTAQTEFVLGDTVCLKVNGVLVNPTFPNKISWVDTVGFIEQKTDLTMDPQTDSFVLPADDTSEINGVTIDNRGIWRINLTRNNGRILNTTLINVRDANNAAAHLIVRKFVSGGELSVDAGSTVRFVVALENKGPDAASAVSLSDPTPPNLEFVSFTQTAGPQFACDNGTCTATGLAAGASAEFLAEYRVTAGTAGGTVIANTALVASPTSDPDSTTRAATSEITVVNSGNQATCALECPGNITVTANTTQGTESGAIVTFGSAEPSGDCGSVTASPVSGSFFSVGTHTVTVSSSTGGGSCSFLVTVLQDNPPTITCPLPDLTGDATGGTSANVSVTAPAATGTNVAVSGVRSDAQLVGDPPANSPDLTDPYPIGTTIITWTATEFINGEPGRTASCTQRVIVTAADAPTITCPVDKSFNQTGCDALTLTAAQIGTPSTTGNISEVEGTRGDGLHLTNDPYPVGVTVITWTATDNLGRVASCTQRITVVAVGDTQPPSLTAPPNVIVDTNSCGQIVGETELGTATATDNCGTVNIARSGVPAGNFFPTGTTTITYTATDGAGNTSTATQTVTVRENPAIPPTISAPADLSFNTGPTATSCGVFVSDAVLGAATANDNCPGVTVTRTGVPAGNNFPVGVTIVTYTATDRSGNTATDTQTITVVDDTKPVVTPPAAVTLFTGPGATSCSVTVSNLDATLGTATATDNCPGVGAVVRTGVPAGNVFPVGNTTLTYTVTDAHGNTSVPVTQVVTVVDNTAPVISCPTDIVLEPSCPSGAIATYSTPTATDNCGVQSVNRTAGLASGSVFPIGTTTVTHVATDIYGNTASCSFTVTVLTPAQTVQNLINTVNALPGLTGQQRQGLLSKLTAALDAINENKTTVACNKLADFISQVQSYISNGTLTSAQGQPLINSAAKVRNTIGCTALPCT
jgi:uncharacterized repeat protein (TIGR01451 family)